jgi:hypothetical protein
VLWRQVIADQRVNSPFQRFKRNLLLLLQILLLALLVFAAMQPLLRSGATRAERLPVLLDVSASMAALDKPGGLSRLDAAKQKVRELISALPSDQQLCLIAFGKTARRLTGFHEQQIELREALETLAVEDVAGDLEEGSADRAGAGPRRAFRSSAAFLRRKFSRADKLRTVLPHRLSSASNLQVQISASRPATRGAACRARGMSLCNLRIRGG